MNKKELRYQIARSGLTRKTIAKMMGIGLVTLHRKLNGTTQFTRGELMLIKEILELDDKTFIDIFFVDDVA